MSVGFQGPNELAWHCNYTHLSVTTIPLTVEDVAPYGITMHCTTIRNHGSRRRMLRDGVVRTHTTWDGSWKGSCRVAVLAFWDQSSPPDSTIGARRARKRAVGGGLSQTAVNEPGQTAVGTPTISMQSTIDSMQSICSTACNQLSAAASGRRCA